MTSTWAAVPFKGRRGGKQRLAELLGETERQLLVNAMLADVLAALSACSALDRIIVVSPDADPVLAVHDPVSWLIQPSGGAPPGSDLNLNQSLMRVQALANDSAVERLLVVPADLPLLHADDVSAMLAGAREFDGSGAGFVVIAPDGALRGTNSLLLSPPDVLAPRFGPQSYQAHLKGIAESALPSAIVRRPGLGLDIDTTSDLREFLSLAKGGETLALLRSLLLERSRVHSQLSSRAK